MVEKCLCQVGVGCYFFFQAEDGIRDLTVTGVQTCALPVSTDAPPSSDNEVSSSLPAETAGERLVFRNGSSGLSNAAMTCGMPLPRVGFSTQIGRASCRERV